MLRLTYRQSDPSCAQDTPELAVREQRHVSFEVSQPTDQAVRSSRDLLGRFTVRASILKDVPVWTFLANVCWALSFIVAVVPLDSVGVDLGGSTQSRMLAGSARAQ